MFLQFSAHLCLEINLHGPEDRHRQRGFAGTQNKTHTPLSLLPIDAQVLLNTFFSVGDKSSDMFWYVAKLLKREFVNMKHLLEI